MDKEYLYFNEKSKFHPEYEKKLGSRSDNMFKAIDALCEIMLKSDVNTFYLNLKIEL